MNAIQTEIQTAVDAAVKPLITEVQNLNELIRKSPLNSDSKYVSLSKAAKEIGVCTKTLRRRVKEGNIKFKRFGNRIFIERSEIFTNQPPKSLFFHEYRDRRGASFHRFKTFQTGSKDLDL